MEKPEMMKVMNQIAFDVGLEGPAENQVEEVMKELD